MKEQVSPTSYRTLISRDISPVGISVSIMTRLRARRPEFDSWQTQWRNVFSSLPHPDRLYGPPSLLSDATGNFFAGGKATGAWSWLLPCSAEVENRWNYTSIPADIFNGVLLS